LARRAVATATLSIARGAALRGGPPGLLFRYRPVDDSSETGRCWLDLLQVRTNTVNLRFDEKVVFCFPG